MKKILLVIFVIVVIFAIYGMKNYNQYDNQYTDNSESLLEQDIVQANQVDYAEKYKKFDYVTKLEDGTYKNDSEKIKETKEINGLRFENATITGNSEKINVDIQVTKVSEKTITGIAKLQFYNKAGEQTMNIEYPVEELVKQNSTGIKIEYPIDDTMSEYWDVTDYLTAYDYQVSIEENG